MIKVFVDTNIVFSFWRRFVFNGFSLDYTTFGQDNSIQCCISLYVVLELITVSERHNILRDQERFADLLILLHIQYHDITGSQHGLDQTVYDLDDIQIVADAIMLGCDYLLTHNGDDFNQDVLQQEYDLVCIQSLHQI